MSELPETPESPQNAVDLPRLTRLRQKAIAVLELARPILSTDDPDPAMKTLLELVHDIIAATEVGTSIQYHYPHSELQANNLPDK